MRFPEPGELFEGRFRVEGELGAGGFSRVYRVRDERSSRLAALKVLVPEQGSYTHETRARFDREVAVISNLKHPNTVTLFDRGMSAGGLLYMVFEHVPGEDLNALLRREGQLSPAATVSILVQVLGALGEAHAAGLVHRDIKPQNIRVCSPRGAPIEVRLLDFGIARSTDAGGPSITKTGELVGTPRYMSPEQLTEKPLTPRSDIYSLGMVAFELLVGSHALPGNNWGDQLARLREGHSFDTAAFGAIDPHLSDVIRRMTARDPAARYPSAAAVIADLQGRSMPLGVPVDGEHHTPSRSKPIVSLGVLLLLIVVCSMVAWKLTTEKSSPQTQAATSERVPNALVASESTRTEEPAAPIEVVPDDLGVHDAALEPVDGGTSGCRVAKPPQFDEVKVLAPDGYDPRTPHPAIVWLMADQEPPMRVPTSEHMRRLIEEENVLLIVPFGATNNDWRSDQLAYVRYLVELVKENYCVDPDRVFVASTGGSGHLSTILSCEPWVAAVAVSSFLGPTDRLERCGPILWISAEDSVHLPIEGGLNCIPVVPSRVEPLEKVETQMRLVNGCKGRPHKQPGSRGMCRSWNCEIPFESCLLDGGVGWPGAGQTAISKNWGPAVGCNEPAPSDFDATRYAWDFFERVSKR